MSSVPRAIQLDDSRMRTIIHFAIIDFFFQFARLDQLHYSPSDSLPNEFITVLISYVFSLLNWAPIEIQLD